MATQYYPQQLSEYIGQPSVITQVNVDLTSARIKGKPYPHTLIYGNSGCGKTALAEVVANEMESQLITYAASALKDVETMMTVLLKLENFDVLFIDEIHSLKPKIQEVLYQAIDKQALSVILVTKKGEEKQVLPLPPFTLLGATIQLGRVSTPLVNRFQNIYRLEPYQPDQLARITSQSYHKLGYDLAIDELVFLDLAQRSRGTPRVANNLLAKTYQYAIAHKQPAITSKTLLATCQMAEIDSLGLGKQDVRLLALIARSFNNRPVGLTTMASALLEDERTIETIYEPYLLQLGFLERTPRGRQVTEVGLRYLDEHYK